MNLHNPHLPALGLDSSDMATLPNLAFDSGLPANVDAEKTILGAILLDNAAHAEAAEKLDAEDFSLDSHRRIFLRMTRVDERASGPWTSSPWPTSWPATRRSRSVGGVAYLASLTEGLPRRPVIEEYIRIVKDKSLLRKLMLICSAAIARAADQGETRPRCSGRRRGATDGGQRKGPHAGLPVARPDRPALLRDHRQPLQAEPRGHRPGHRFHRIRPHDQRPAKGRADHHRRAALDGQNRAGHQHRPERGHQPRRHRWPSSAWK